MLQANMRDREGKNAQSLRQGGGVNTGTQYADSAILDWLAVDFAAAVSKFTDGER